VPAIHTPKLYENEFFLKTVNVVRKGIVWNQIRWFVFTFILRPHKTGDYQKLRFIFHRAFFKRKNNNGRFWITCNFFCNITVRNYEFIELKAVLKWFEFSVRSGHVTNDVTTVSISWSSLSCKVLLTSQALFLPPLNYHSYWLLTSPLGNPPVQSHLNFQMPDVNWQFPYCPFQWLWGHVICFWIDGGLFLQWAKTYFFAIGTRIMTSSP